MRQFDIEDVVLQLVGPIRPVGESNEDGKRIANLKELTVLVDRLLQHIHEAAQAQNNHQASMRAIGEFAAKFLESVRET